LLFSCYAWLEAVFEGLLLTLTSGAWRLEKPAGLPGLLIGTPVILVDRC